MKMKETIAENYAVLFDKYLALTEGDAHAAFDFFNRMHPHVYRDRTTYAIIYKKYKAASK